MRRFVPIQMRSFLGALIRNFLRNRGKWLTIAVEGAVEPLSRSLEINGYGNLPKNNTKYEILFLSKSDDIDILLTNIKNIAKPVLENCMKINVIVNIDSQAISKVFSSTDLGIAIEVFDENVLFEEISELKKAISKYNKDRHSWYLQQVLKTMFVYQHHCPVLIIDSDTVIMSPINFIQNDRQVLLVGKSFHFPYSRHTQKYLGSSPLPFSFVHHCQLQQPQIVKEIYGNNIVKGLNRWLEAGHSRAEYSCVSEFQTYGDYLLRKYPEKVRLLFHKHEFLDVQGFQSEISTEMLHKAITRDRHIGSADLLTFANKHLRNGRA